MRDMRIETAAAAGGQLGQLSHISAIILVLITLINSGLRSYHLSIYRSICSSGCCQLATRGVYTMCSLFWASSTNPVNYLERQLSLWPLGQFFSSSPCTAFPGQDKPFFFISFAFVYLKRGVVRFAAFFGSSPIRTQGGIVVQIFLYSIKRGGEELGEL